MFDPRLGKPLRITMYALDEDGNLDRDALEGEQCLMKLPTW